MKLNNKGFAISGVLYPVFVLFLVLIFGIVGVLSSSKTLIDRIRNEVELELNGKDLTPTITMTGSDITIANGYTFDLMEGVKAFDYEGKELGPERITYVSTPTFSNTVNGVYEIVYTATDVKGRTKSFTRTLRVETGAIYDYAYTGGAQTFTVPADGIYKIETWGAQGGNSKYNNDGSGAVVLGGLGAYAKGDVSISKDSLLGIYVGGKGTDGIAGTRASGGYNGGGLGGSAYQGGAGGGGSTDIRILNPNRYRYVRDYIGGSTANTGNHWVEIQVFDTNNINVALTKTATCFSGGSSLGVITDNLTAFASYASCTAGSDQWVEIDLGSEYPIDRVVVMHYFGDPRTYYQTKTELYSSDRSIKTTIFDSAWTGTYVETAAGRTSNYLDWNTFESLGKRLMVASAGSGASNWTNAVSGGYGGLITGAGGTLNVGAVAHPLATGGTQTAGGTAGGSTPGQPGKFGSGGNSEAAHGSGGGAGYYGGGGSGVISSGVSSGAGGSSFISGVINYNAITSTSIPTAISHTGQPNHYSGLVFTNATMIAGNAVMPAPSGGTQTGNTGNGYARITVLKKINID